MIVIFSPSAAIACCDARLNSRPEATAIWRNVRMRGVIDSLRYCPVRRSAARLHRWADSRRANPSLGLHGDQGAVRDFHERRAQKKPRREALAWKILWVKKSSRIRR